MNSPVSAAPSAGRPVARCRVAPAWKLWANPIIRRYWRSRLRPHGLGASLLLTLILAGFIFFLSRTIGLHRGDLALIDAERLPLIPLLVLQSLILFLLGTGQVAGGITAEADEGVLDYQRLAPMSPIAKVLGYLFGLPVREYALFLATTPFTAWAIWRGGVPVAIAAQLYGVFLFSAILYHVTGLVAGTVVTNRRWAFLISMGAIFMLYTVVPQMANFGMVYFKYLTIEPVVRECLPYLIPRDAGAVVQVGQALFPTARFFDLDLPEAVFTVLSQGIFILTGIVMLRRRWRRAESHLLGKSWAAGLFVSIQVLLLGNALPLIETAALFPSLQLNRFTGPFGGDRDEWRPQGIEAVGMAGFFGFATLLMLWVLTLMITPNAETQIRGWRRVFKQGGTRLPAGSDPATASGWVMLMALAGAAGWFVFSRSVLESRWFPGREVPLAAFATFALVLLTAGLGFHALLEGRGGRPAGLAALFLGLVPVMAGAIVATVSDRFAAPAAWLVGISPASAPVYAAASMLSEADLPRELARAIPRAFWFWQGIACLVTAWLLINLRRSRRNAAARAAPADHP